MTFITSVIGTLEIADIATPVGVPGAGLNMRYNPTTRDVYIKQFANQNSKEPLRKFMMALCLEVIVCRFQYVCFKTKYFMSYNIG